MYSLKKLMAVVLSVAMLISTVSFVDNTAVAASGLQDGTVIYYEDFNYADNSNKSSVLSTLGWTVSTDLNANKTNYAFVSGKLLCDSITPAATADSYVTILDNTAMGEVVQGDYTISYKLTYIEAANYTRYGCLIYNYNGYKSYNSVHLRIAGYGNNQVRTATNWKDYEADGSYYMKSTGTASISYKLFGTQCLSANASTNTGYPFVQKELTVRIAVDKDSGPTVYVNNTKVSVPTTKHNELFLSSAEYAAAIALKTSKEVKLYMDDIMVYTGLGAIPTGVTKESVTYKSPITPIDKNAIKVMTFNTLFSDQSTDVFGNGITRTYHMSNVVSGFRPDIVGTQERNKTNMSGVTSLLQSDGGYALVDEYRTDTSVASVVSYVPILYNTSRFSLVANAASNNNNAHGALLFDKSYNIKDMTASEIAAFAGTKGMAWAVLKDKKTGGYVLALNAHFALNSSSYTGYSDEEAIEARLSNAGQAYTKMQEIYDIFGVIPTVFTGDFNMRSYDPAYKYLAKFFESSIYGDDSFIKYEYSMNKVTAATFTRAPNMPIDHIFYTDESLKPVAYYVGNKAPETMIASDHLPVMATFVYDEIAAPTPSHHTDIYSSTQYLTLEGEGLIYYTTDGSDPRSSATRKLYGSAISVSEDTVVKSCCMYEGLYSDINRVTFFFDSPLYITEVIKNAPGTDHIEGFEIVNVSPVEVDLSDFTLWSYNNANEATCSNVAVSDVTSQMTLSYLEGSAVLPSGEVAYCPMVFGDTYLIKDTIAEGQTKYLVTVNEDVTKVTYHTDRYASAIAYSGYGSITANRIFPIDRTARSIGYTESGTLVKRLDYYNSTDGKVNDVTNSFNMGNSSYSKVYLTMATDQDVSAPVCTVFLDSASGGITTADSTTSVSVGSFNFSPVDGAQTKSNGFTSSAVSIGSLTAEQKTAVDAAMAKRVKTGGQAITNAAEFAAMTASGSYYLANDITIDATYTTVFTGVLDGRGHTVTTSVPMFADMSGTVKNLTVNGNITVASGYNGAVAKQTSGNAVYDSITVNANLSGGSSTGGLVGYGPSGASIVATRCINNGNHSGTSQVGGLVGYVQGLTVAIDECINYGNISSTSYSGGIICRFGKNASTMSYRCNITNCINYGDVTSTNTRAAGVLAYSVGDITISGCINYGHIYNTGNIVDFSAGGIYGEGSSTYTSGTTTVNAKNSIAIRDCYNYGKIEATSSAGGIIARTSTVAPASGYTYSIESCGNAGEIIFVDGGSGKASRGAGGIVGYFYGTTNHSISRCYNVGKVTASSSATDVVCKAAGIASYFNGTKVYFRDCYNAGTVTASGTAVAYQLFYNNNATGGASGYITNNYALTVSGATYEKNGTQAASYTTFTAAQLADGTLRAKINTGAGKPYYYQKVGVEAYPVLREYKGFDLWSIILKDGVEYSEDGTYLYKVNEKTRANGFIDSFVSPVWLYNGEDTTAPTDYVCTGFTVTSFDKSEELVVIVVGDADCNGGVTSTDYLMIKEHLRKAITLGTAQCHAADMDSDGAVSSADCISLKLKLK